MHNLNQLLLVTDCIDHDIGPTKTKAYRSSSMCSHERGLTNSLSSNDGSTVVLPKKITYLLVLFHVGIGVISNN